LSAGTGEGPGHLPGGRRPADRGLRPHLGVRRGPAHGDPRQGTGPHRAVAVLVRTVGRRRAQPRPVGRRGEVPVAVRRLRPAAARHRALTWARARSAAGRAAARGISLADTKFECGEVDDDGLILIDEALTPDSSRFWPAEGYEPGHGQPSFDKQYVRDWLDAADWNKEPPAPELPDDVVQGTSSRYCEAYARITGEAFQMYLQRVGVER